MAFLSNTAFEARVTNGEFDALANITGEYMDNASAADCAAGLLCVRGDNLPCEGFGSTVFNENAFYMTAAASDVTGNTPIYACNPYTAKKVNGYYIGTETLGIGLEAGEYGTFTRIAFDGVSKYRFGEGNFTAAVSDASYVVLAGDGLLESAASIPSNAGTPYFVVKGQGAFVEGTTDSFGYVDLEAHLA